MTYDLVCSALGAVVVGCIAQHPLVVPFLPTLFTVVTAALMLKVLSSQSSKAPAAPAAATTANATGDDGVSLPTPAQTLRLLKARRSMFPKDYNGRGREVEEEDVRLMLEGATWAPTHKRNEPWRFVVLTGKAKKRVFECTLAGNRAATDEERGASSTTTRRPTNPAVERTKRARRATTPRPQTSSREMSPNRWSRGQIDAWTRDFGRVRSG